MGSTAEEYGWMRGMTRPAAPGIFEIHYMGRRVLVNVKRDESGDLLVYGVPGSGLAGMPVSDFDRYLLPRTDDTRRTAASNLSEYDRAVSRYIAGLTALRDEVFRLDSEKEDKELRIWAEIGYIDAKLALSYEATEDRDGVDKAVKERLSVWYIEDHEAIPLPSEGPGSPPEGTDIHGRDAG